jgi:hypothetical protein
MITSLIELAEEMYEMRINPPDDVGDAMEDFAIRLGHLIEEVGKELYFQQEAIRIKDLKIQELTGESNADNG